MELWDLYDQNRVKLHQTMVRGEKFQKGTYHLVVHACIFNSHGDMLIQQRQSFKDGWPNMWDITVGGSALAGETSQTAAERELFEELGLQVDFQHIRPHLTIHFDTGFDDIYLIEKEVLLGDLKLQYEEVQQVKWASLDKIYQKLEEGIFIPYHRSLIQLLFDIRKQYGCHQIK